MKMLVITLLLFSLSFAAIASEGSHTAEAKKITGAFFEELKDELSKAFEIGRLRYGNQRMQKYRTGHCGEALEEFWLGRCPDKSQVA